MSSPRSNARQSLTVTRFSPLRAASPQQIISPLNPRHRQIALNSPTFQRRYGFANQKRKFQARKQDIRLRSSKQVTLPEKKKIINQKGGALLGVLLKPLLGPIMKSVLGGLVQPPRHH